MKAIAHTNCQVEHLAPYTFTNRRADCALQSALPLSTFPSRLHPLQLRNLIAVEFDQIPLEDTLAIFAAGV